MSSPGQQQGESSCLFNLEREHPMSLGPSDIACKIDMA